jgi:hypothetical protein
MWVISGEGGFQGLPQGGFLFTWEEQERRVRQEPSFLSRLRPGLWNLCRVN